MERESWDSMPMAMMPWRVEGSGGPKEGEVSFAQKEGWKMVLRWWVVDVW